MATDNFNRSDGGLGANWTGIGGNGTGCEVVSNTAQLVSFGSNHFNYYDGASFDDDQSSEVVIVTGTALDADMLGPGPTTRGSDLGGSGGTYFLSARGNELGLHRFAAGGGLTSYIDFGGVTLADGDTVKLTSEGTLHTAYHNDVEIFDHTDATFTSGKPGIGGRIENDETTLAEGAMDDWEGLSLGGGGGAEVFFENRHAIEQGMKPQTAAGLGGVLIQYVRDGRKFFRHNRLRTVWARELHEALPRFGAAFRAKLIAALKRSTRAWLTRTPNFRMGWHIKRCREIWQVMEAYSG